MSAISYILGRKRGKGKRRRRSSFFVCGVICTLHLSSTPQEQSDYKQLNGFLTIFILDDHHFVTEKITPDS